MDPFSIYKKSEHSIAREVEDEFIIALIGPNGTENFGGLYFLNETGRELWEHMDGELTLNQMIEKISRQYSSGVHEQIRQDLCNLINKLLEYGIIKKV